MNLDEQKILFKYEYPLKWRDLHKIRSALSLKLGAAGIPRQQADPLIIIISELVENAFKYSDKKLVMIILKYISGPHARIVIKIHHPVSTYKSEMLKRFILDITQVNGAKDIDRMYLETLREAVFQNTKANRFRLSLVRKTAKGAPILLKKSLIYTPGISIGVAYSLS